jgi:hypothetical protein
MLQGTYCMQKQHPSLVQGVNRGGAIITDGNNSIFVNEHWWYSAFVGAAPVQNPPLLNPIEVRNGTGHQRTLTRESWWWFRCFPFAGVAPGRNPPLLNSIDTQGVVHSQVVTCTTWWFCCFSFVWAAPGQNPPSLSSIDTVNRVHRQTLTSSTLRLCCFSSARAASGQHPQLLNPIDTYWGIARHQQTVTRST